jgi:hypothetical protein
MKIFILLILITLSVSEENNICDCCCKTKCHLDCSLVKCACPVRTTPYSENNPVKRDFKCTLCCHSPLKSKCSMILKGCFCRF